MSCKIKGASLFDDHFMKSFNLLRSIKMNKETCLKRMKLADEIGRTFQKVEKIRDDILQKECVKGNDGKPKIKNNDMVFKDQKLVQSLIMQELTKEYDLDCACLSWNDVSKAGMTDDQFRAAVIVLSTLGEKENREE